MNTSKSPVSRKMDLNLKGLAHRRHMSSNTPFVNKSSAEKEKLSSTNHKLSCPPNRLENIRQNLPVIDKENNGSGPNNGLQRMSNSFMKTPTTVPAGILGIRKRLEQQFSSSCNTPTMSGQEVSPGLAKIQNTPGTLKKRKQELIVKHKDIQDRSDQLGVGGGVTLWPEMEVVRLSTKDMLSLFSSAVILSLLTLLVFNKIHGKTFMQLQTFFQDIRTECENHKISIGNESTSFNNEVLLWHKFLLIKSESIQSYFHVSITSSHYVLYLVSYSLGMSTLVYFLVDNMQAKNRLTPLRIKTWACLLFVIGTWTILMAFGLYLAFRLEKETVNCVYKYANLLGHLVLTPLDLSTYQSVLLYWRARLLDNSSGGLIHVLGIVTVKDLIFYLHYYSIPVATVLLTPVIKLVMNLWTIYGNDMIKVT